MKQKPFISTAVLITILLFVLVGGSAAATPYEGRMAVVLMIDASGSMAHNDPERVRVQAAQRMVEVLKNGDYLAAIEFATEVRLLAPMRTVGAAAERREIAALIAQARQQGDTNILSGLRSAFQQLEGVPAEARKFVILLSDGESDVPGVTNTPRGHEQYFAETEGLLARYREQGWAVHCIAFREAEAGVELENIAAKTDGEYQFVTAADDLKNIFTNILLAAKYPPGVQPTFHAALRQREGLSVGDRLTAEAYLTVGKDRVLPGPYLEVTGMNLILTGDHAAPQVIPFREARNGLFRAEYDFGEATEYEAMVALTARYRGQEIGKSVTLGTVAAVERMRIPVVSLDGEQAKSMAILSLYGVGFTLLVVVTFLLWRARLRERVGGELRVFLTGGRDIRYIKHRLKLRKIRRRQACFATAKGKNVHFVLDPLEREFSFIIRTVRDPVQDSGVSRFRRIVNGPRMLYEIVCRPGTAILAGDKLRTRRDLYHGDTFEVGGYAFKFEHPRLAARPGGVDVLDSYSALLRDGSKSKGGKIITLRPGDK